ncbi:MAG: hypothetical protein ABI895_34485 [Deltaproteobacteria bacterium]
MNDSATEGSASNGDAGTTPTTAEGSNGDTISANGHPAGTHLVRDAISLIKQHPLGAVATVAAATAFIEVELAVGILAGLGATALLASQSGPEARQRVLARGKWALDRARVAVAKAKSPPPVAPPV